MRNRFVTSVLYEPPVGKGKLLNIDSRVLNGFIGGVDNASTSDGGYDRPNSTGLSPYLVNETPSRWLNLAAFPEAPPGQFGNVGRNTIESSGVFNLDAEIHKQFRMPYTENHTLQFRFEAFNSVNHPNWGMPNLNILQGAAQIGMPTTVAHQGFAIITSTLTSMRQIQLGLKYSF